MDSEFKSKAKRYEEMLEPRSGNSGNSGNSSKGDVGGNLEEEVVPVWLKDGAETIALSNKSESVPGAAAHYHHCVALMVLKADATSKDATWGEAVIDQTVQFGQPYPAVTHVELWMGDRPTERARTTTSARTLAPRKGALWTSG